MMRSCMIRSCAPRWLCVMPMPAMVAGCAAVMLAAAVSAADPATPVAADPAAGIAFFESKIRPLLVDNCYGCHAADTEQKGSLLLDTKAGLLKGGDTGPAIVPGKPDQSLLVQAVKHHSGQIQAPHRGQRPPPADRAADGEVGRAMRQANRRQRDDPWQRTGTL